MKKLFWELFEKSPDTTISRDTLFRNLQQFSVIFIENKGILQTLFDGKDADLSSLAKKKNGRTHYTVKLVIFLASSAFAPKTNSNICREKLLVQTVIQQVSHCVLPPGPLLL